MTITAITAIEAIAGVINIFNGIKSNLRSKDAVELSVDILPRLKAGDSYGVRAQVP